MTPSPGARLALGRALGRLALLLALLLGGGPTSGCAPAAVTAAGGPPERAEEPALGDQHPAAPRPAAGLLRAWMKLGSVIADGRQDRDTLSLAPEQERPYEALGLRIHDSRIVIDDIVVEYADGTRQALPAPRIFEEGESRSIELSADGRRVRAVHLRYGELRRGGPGAALEIWAR